MDLEGQKKNTQFTLQDTGNGNHIPMWMRGQTQVQCLLTMAITQHLQLQGRKTSWFQEAQGPMQGKTSGSAFEDKLFGCGLRTAKMEQEALSIGWKSLERCP